MLPASARKSFEPFAVTDYRYLWTGTALLFLAFTISMVSQAIIAYDITGKNSSVGLVALCSGIAMTIGSPFGGVIGDRVDKRRLLVIAQVLVAMLLAVIGVIVVAGAMTVALLAAAVFLMGLCFCVIIPARQAWVPAILPARQAADGAALQQLAVTVMGLAGPFIGGVFIALPFLGIGGTYLVLTGLTLVTVLLVMRTRASSGGQGSQSSAIEDLKLGLMHVMGRPRLAILVLSFYGVILAGSSYAVLLPGILEDELDREASQVAWLMTMSGIGGLVATAAVSALPVARQTTTLLAGGCAVLGVGLALVGNADSFGGAMLFMLVVGVGIGTVQLLNTSLVMREADPHYYGRVMSLVMLAWGINGIGALGMGVLADAIGGGRTMVVMGGFVLVLTAATWVTLRALNTRGTPPGARIEPATQRVETAGGEP